MVGDFGWEHEGRKSRVGTVKKKLYLQHSHLEAILSYTIMYLSLYSILAIVETFQIRAVSQKFTKCIIQSNLLGQILQEYFDFLTAYCF